MLNLAYLYQPLRLKGLIYRPLPFLHISDENVVSISLLTIAVQRTKIRVSDITIWAHVSAVAAWYNTTSFQFFFFSGAATQRGSWPPNSWGFLGHTRRTTVGRTPLDEWSARRRDLYLTTHNTHNRQTSMPPGEVRTHDLSRRAASDLRLRPRGHWDRHKFSVSGHKI